MLLSRSGRFDEVEAIGLNPPDAEPDNASRRGGSVNRPYLRFVWLLAVLLLIGVSASQLFAQAKGHKKKQPRTTVTPGVSPGEQTLTNIPLPIGHEAKGLVLPDFDGEGHLGEGLKRGRRGGLTRSTSAFNILRL